MRKLQEILRLRFEAGRSLREIALSACVALSTVQEVLRRFVVAGLVWPLPTELDEAMLTARLYPVDPVPRRPEPDFVALDRALSRKGMTRKLLWEGYALEHGEAALSYPQVLRTLGCIRRAGCGGDATGLPARRETVRRLLRPHRRGD